MRWQIQTFIFFWLSSDKGVRVGGVGGSQWSQFPWQQPGVKRLVCNTYNWPGVNASAVGDHNITPPQPSAPHVTITLFEVMLSLFRDLFILLESERLIDRKVHLPGFCSLVWLLLPLNPPPDHVAASICFSLWIQLAITLNSLFLFFFLLQKG